LFCLVVGWVLGCRSPAPVNQAIDSWDFSASQRRSALGSEHRSGRVLLALTFSGGGTRAAAFSYGVLQELAETTIRIDGREGRLLDEIDLISSVSGGSFTGAYFGLHGDAIFDDYEDVFLRRNVQRGLALEVLRPRHWLGFLGLDRSQLAAHYYDRHIFRGATFADFRQRPGSPNIILNATDLTTAARFPFVDAVFGMICSDLDSYPIAHAVTASSAVPIVFPTVRLENHAGDCEFEEPAWLGADQSDSVRTLQGILRHEIRTEVEGLQDRDYIHLLDGGLSDNLGLINGLAALSMTDDHAAMLRDIGHTDLELILVVTVNAEAETERAWDGFDKSASPIQVVNGITGAQMESKNRLTLNLVKVAFAEMAEEVSTPEKPVRFVMIDVSFARVQDPDERRMLRRIETSFNLSDEKVDRLMGAARRVLRESPQLGEALEIIGNLR